MKIKIHILIGFIIVLMFSSCNAYYNLFYTDPTKCFSTACLKKPYDVIIIPGFPHDSGKVNMVLSERVKWAYYLYKNGYAKNIIFSGSAVHTPYVEAKVMRLLALQIGIKDEHIFTETKAEHTTENLYYSCMMAEQLGFKSIGFATEPAQASFMKPFKRKFHLNLDFIPVVTDSLYPMKIQLNPIDESVAFVPNFIALKQREGTLKSLRRTRGHRVKQEMRQTRRLKRQQKHSTI
ncbi:MAG: YdcF family protein [Bacteroidia bacterium]|nr:YdcF family protein [Bacteroidia bacterium]